MTIEKKKNKKKIDLGKAFLRKFNKEDGDEPKEKKSFWLSIRIPALAILTGLLIGGRS